MRDAEYMDKLIDDCVKIVFSAVLAVAAFEEYPARCLSGKVSSGNGLHCGIYVRYKCVLKEISVVPLDADLSVFDKKCVENGFVHSETSYGLLRKRYVACAVRETF
jgi:hypothetical protein